MTYKIDRTLICGLVVLGCAMFGLAIYTLLDAMKLVETTMRDQHLKTLPGVVVVAAVDGAAIAAFYVGVGVGTFIALVVSLLWRLLQKQ